MSFACCKIADETYQFQSVTLRNGKAERVLLRKDSVVALHTSEVSRSSKVLCTVQCGPR
jgi:hypothetical protein